MAASDIPMDKAELLSVILEGILYGFSLLMFGGTIWVLCFRSSSRRVNREMLAVASALFVLSTTHLVIHIIRVMEGLILYGDSYPGGVNVFFGDVSHWTLVAKSYVYVTQSLVGDGVILHRCYAVWRSKLVMIFPVILWCATGVTGYAAVHTQSKLKQDKVFSGDLGKWITAFWATALSTNLVATSLLAGRIWYIGRKLKKLCIGRKSELWPVLHIIIDAGVVYSLILLVTLVCFVSGTNGQYVTLDMVTPIISITFYVVIIRVGLASLTNQVADMAPFQCASPIPCSNGVDRRSRMEVRVTTLRDNKIGDDLYLPLSAVTPVSRDNRLHEITLDGFTLEA